MPIPMKASAQSPESHSVRLFDQALLKSILTIAIPVTLQTILFSSKGLVDLIMIGQLSEHDIAAVGVAGRALFVATILLSGVTTGGRC